MRERMRVQAIAGLTALATVAAAPAAVAGTSRVVREPAAVSVAPTLAGPVLVDHRGDTVFIFSRERRGDGVCARIRRCLTDWPPVTTTGHPRAGRGVRRALLASIPYRGALRQVTYDGHPLHTYRFDGSPRSVMNIGNMQFGGAWWALNADGRPLK
jgi:predicted lipoprotein with Yx(FWY)xxD motif